MAFNTPGGPVVAFAGLCGGAGVSTLTYLTACAIAAESTNPEAPTLAIDAGATNGGLSFYAGAASPHTLSTFAADIFHSRPLTSPFTTTEDNVVLLAGAPAANDETHPEAVRRIVNDARPRFGITLIDCGTLAHPDQRAALDAATHIVWVLPATNTGVERAARMLKSVTRFLPGQEIICARRDHAEKKPPMSKLEALTDERVADLLLIPHIPELASHALSDALDAAELALQAFAILARR